MMLESDHTKITKIQTESCYDKDIKKKIIGRNTEMWGGRGVEGDKEL